jgi:hypothetical protein
MPLSFLFKYLISLAVPREVCGCKHFKQLQWLTGAHGSFDPQKLFGEVANQSIGLMGFPSPIEKRKNRWRLMLS